MRAQVVLENVGIRYPGKTLFEGVNFTVYEGMRVTLAGRNGSGKSTLMQIIAGEMEPHQGTRNIVGNRKLRIGYLDQKLLEDSVIRLKSEGKDQQTATAFLAPYLVNEEEGIYEEQVTWEIEKVLRGLGFQDKLLEASMSHLSGGWLLRVFIAKALLEKPELLLLDEPTNHLDISTIQWLENFLTKEYKGSLILITHDVALQKRASDSLAILHGSRFYYQKNLSDYLSFKSSLVEEKVLVEKAIESLEKKIEENLAFVERFRAKAQTAARAQSKLKAAGDLEEEMLKLKHRLEQIEGKDANLKFRIQCRDAGAKFPAAIKDLSFRYNDEMPWLLKNISFDIKRGQKIAIMGDNGTGKTTLLNLLSGRLTPKSGSIDKGYQVLEGFFGQHQLEELELDYSLADNLRMAAEYLTIEMGRRLLGAFGFIGDETIAKKAKVLSGGEKARLALLRMIVKPINFCLLDEPTNHLDVETKAILKDSLKEFEGTVVLVSHDRDFISGLCDRILHLSVSHEFTDHLGDLDSFFDKYPEKVNFLDAKTQKANSGASPKKPEAAVEKLSFEERKKMKNRMKALEKQIEKIEANIEAMGKEKEHLVNSGANMDFKRHGEIDQKLKSLMVEWEQNSTELAELKEKHPDILH